MHESSHEEEDAGAAGLEQASNLVVTRFLGVASDSRLSHVFNGLAGMARKTFYLPLSHRRVQLIFCGYSGVISRVLSSRRKNGRSPSSRHFSEPNHNRD